MTGSTRKPRFIATVRDDYIIDERRKTSGAETATPLLEGAQAAE
jgi:hypothetical protein